MGSTRILKRLSVLVRALLGVLVLAVAIGFAAVLVKTKPQPARQARETPVLAVRAVTLSPVDAPRVWDGYGSARAMNVAEVAAEVSARVVSRPASIEPGMRVSRGDVILELDARDFESRLRSAEARADALSAQIDGIETQEGRLREQAALIAQEVAIQQRELDRSLEARDRGAANTSETELRLIALRRAEREFALLSQQLENIPFQRAQLEAQRDEQRSQATIARNDLGRALVRSPIDGILQRVDYREGDMVPPNAPVARVIDLSRIEVPLRAPVSAAVELRVGDDANLRSEAALSRQWKGDIARIAPEADAQSRSVTLFVEVVQDPLADPTTLLRPGQFVGAAITSSTRSPRLIVPRRAVDGDRVFVGVEDPEAPGTYRVESRVIRVLYHLEGSYPVLDPVETQWAAIEGEVSAGQIVIASNLDELLPGQRVRVGQAPAPPAPTAAPTAASPVASPNEPASQALPAAALPKRSPAPERDP